MSALLLHPGPVPVQVLSDALRRELPQLSVRVWPDIGNPLDICYALVSRIPRGVLASLPGLKMVGSLHAGVEHLLAHGMITEGVPITRPVPVNGDRFINEYVLAHVLMHHRNLPHYARLQQESRWEKLPILPISQRAVGVLGMGAMGAPAALLLSQVGFDVAGWARLPRQGYPLPIYSGEDGLKELMERSEILVNLLPLTELTRDLLNAERLGWMPKGSVLINLGRGEHVVDADLLEALDCGRLSAASLDVFRVEPLPPEHPFWRHPALTITPHAARNVDAVEVVRQFAEEVRRHAAGEGLRYAVNRESGY